MHNPNAASSLAPLTTTIWKSKDGMEEVDIYQYNDGDFVQVFTTYSRDIRNLPYGVFPEKYQLTYNDSSVEGSGRKGCYN